MGDTRALSDLLHAIPGAVRVEGVTDAIVTGVYYDSRRVETGGLFCALEGEHADGHDYVADAMAAGAVAVMVSRRLDVAAPQIIVEDTRLSMALVAAEFAGHPSDRLSVIGVTGTNGKTTVTHLLAQIFTAAGDKSSVMGTLSGARTTPEAPDFQAELRSRVLAGDEVVAVEVSSHALDMHRVDGTRFVLSIFTNLSRDHLDYHPTMEAYFQAKARLFEPSFTEKAVVNLDSRHGRLLRDAAMVATVGFSIDDAVDLQVDADGSRFIWRGVPIELPLIGRFNVSNALAAATAASELGVGADVIAAGLANVAPVRGRFEAVDEGQPFLVVVDYAHTPDALEHALETARELAPGGRVHVVFGCGGDRDRTKRAPMGEVAARLADHVVVTSDNPRGEDPGAIAEEIVSGAGAAHDLVVEVDRAEAIRLAFESASNGDVVLVAGKGHETTQTAGDSVIEFDDRVVSRDALHRLAAGRRNPA